MKTTSVSQLLPNKINLIYAGCIDSLDVLIVFLSEQYHNESLLYFIQAHTYNFSII